MRNARTDDANVRDTAENRSESSDDAFGLPELSFSREVPVVSGPETATDTDTDTNPAIEPDGPRPPVEAERPESFFHRDGRDVDDADLAESFWRWDDRDRPSRSSRWRFERPRRRPRRHAGAAEPNGAGPASTGPAPGSGPVPGPGSDPAPPPTAEPEPVRSVDPLPFLTPRRSILAPSDGSGPGGPEPEAPPTTVLPATGSARRRPAGPVPEKKGDAEKPAAGSGPDPARRPRAGTAPLPAMVAGLRSSISPRMARRGAAAGAVLTVLAVAATVTVLVTRGDDRVETAADVPAETTAPDAPAATDGLGLRARLDDGDGSGESSAADLTDGAGDAAGRGGISTETTAADDVTTVDDDPSTTAARRADPSTTAAQRKDPTTAPSTRSPSDPTTTPPSDPSTTAPADPTTAPPSDPSTTAPADPTTTSPADPTTTPPMDPPAETTCFLPSLTETFDGTAVDASTWVVLDGAGAGGNGVRSPEAVTVSDGVLTISAEQTDDGPVSGGVRLGSTQTYGRYEVTVRTDVNEALGAVVTTRAASGGGHHDLYRNDGGATADAVVGLTDGSDRTVALGADAGAWHTVALEWTPESVAVHLDDTLVETVTGAVDDGPHSLTIALDALAGTVTADGPVTMEVDAVTVSSYATGDDCTS